ncbi:calcium/sodium antiporter [[Haemophilus] felis]|nr:calcium/sodium antiporter [[Haemophilus] felis]
MLLEALLAIVVGLVVLVWSADRFVDGAASLARHLGMSSLLIGILVIGFGTSMPEMVVSGLSALNGSSGIALGNAYGSNITNIALILGLTALISPLGVNKTVITKELPVLIIVTALSCWLLWDTAISREESVVLLVVFILYVIATIRESRKQMQQMKGNTLNTGDELMDSQLMPIKKAIFWLILGLLLLMASSQLLVWGAIQVAQYFGVSDLVIGLTVVAVGTSLPEVAASIAAARKSEVDLAIGNIIGSNLYNTLAVVGLAGVIHPIQVEEAVLSRDMLVMSALTLGIFIFSLKAFLMKGRIGRLAGGSLFFSYVVYTIFLIKTAM